MAFTLATHILLVPLGVAMPTLTLLMEGIGIWRKDPIALKIAQRWSVVMAFEFGILWPRMMGRFGAAFGLGFAIEGLAFFVEAIFISIYLYGWKRLSPRAHFLTGLALPPAGRLVSVDTMAALFTPALGYEFWHFLIAIYMTAGFVIASVYAVAWLRGRRDHYQRLAFAIPFTVAAALTPVQLVVGDLSARALVQDQPAKFAAMEITWTTRDHNPEVVA